MKKITGVIAAVLLSLTATAFAQAGGLVSGNGQPVTSSDGTPVEWNGKGTSSAGSP